MAVGYLFPAVRDVNRMGRVLYVDIGISTYL